ncbi:uncharacterized protein YPO0396 [Ruminiclostridium sufflavum DSM 19573]|uniref:Uncharacterized protein YPO0396 n=1 Tax=Ruminiclostridium sufflavum DSM 19573 TaxID=1121337 RepID=A0A318XTL6_9FIRM|nr:SbcC/MukB-like Walker B domain-containing protein [Ruminiclostridium sufflavum]PYG90183.1 uncharacterized protein YPO0396 [Ruminiclostridium sufflavum DSM 19573]
MSRFQVLTKMCLNNWHYINEKLLTFNKEINFFTGHSGSGKSTVLDALQIILYADSNGRSFFNKAAKEDSDRTLIEYLRGMKVVQENNNISYLRNKNFSSSVVLEFQDSETLKYQSIGVAFDVDVSVNSVNHMFFRHLGELLPDLYRDGGRAVSINELREGIKADFSKEDYYFSRTNEKFRSELYSNYFGGLHQKHFPALFKKAIPFRMDMKLEDFVKNYICTENDIHIEDMQDSVAQYIRLRRKLEDTRNEIEALTGIHNQFKVYDKHCRESIQYQYNIDKLDMHSIEARLDRIQLQRKRYEEDILDLGKTAGALEQMLKELQNRRDEVVSSIRNSGYEHLEAELDSLNQMLELLKRNKAEYDKAAEGLTVWLAAGLLEPEVHDGIESFKEYQADCGRIEKIKAAIAGVRSELEKDKEELASRINELKKAASGLTKQTAALKNGQKAYPSYLLEARDYIARELEKYYERPVRVDILADIIEVRDEVWLDAAEGYMGNNKLALIVHPDYAKQAMEIYKGLSPKKYCKAAVIDTEGVLRDIKPVLKNSLAGEVETAEEYTRAYIDFLMGTVIKCGTVEELRENKSGITPDCVLYQGYKLQHINPRNYTEYAYIGRSAIERRLRQLEQDLSEVQAEKGPLDIQLEKVSEILGYESLSKDADFYYKQVQEIREIYAKEEQKQEYIRKINELKEKNIDEWKAKKLELEQEINEKGKLKESVNLDLRTKSREVEDFKNTIISLNGELAEKKKVFIFNGSKEELFGSFMREHTSARAESIRNLLLIIKNESDKKSGEEYEKLVQKREGYRNQYAYRGFSLTCKDNEEYDQLLDNLSSEKLSEFTEKANEQAKLAVYHFKTDFVYKIRDAIKEVLQQKEDLNRVLAQLDFGKDRYKFIITRNQGEDGRFYDMFMDENLEINPHQLTGKIDNQLDLFSMKHEKDYKDLINELIELFMPPENSDSRTMEEARSSMERYADYRTYLSFDMEQLVEGMPPMRLSKMLSKNSGGEGQNPLYVALLASFAQVYRINLKANIRRRPTPRIVVLDEAFSKMDAEKVGSCIGLIRKLGFQAIISSTNDKIQNYVENVDKTFVFANPNKSRISIQEFERKDFRELLAIDGEGDINTL